MVLESRLRSLLAEHVKRINYAALGAEKKTSKTEAEGETQAGRRVRTMRWAIDLTEDTVSRAVR